MIRTRFVSRTRPCDSSVYNGLVFGRPQWRNSGRTCALYVVNRKAGPDCGHHHARTQDGWAARTQGFFYPYGKTYAQDPWLMQD